LVKALLRYGDLSIFQDGCGRQLGFLNFGNFNSQKGQISWRLVNLLLTYGNFSIFKMAAAAILDFKIFTGSTVRRATHQYLIY